MWLNTNSFGAAVQSNWTRVHLKRYWVIICPVPTDVRYYFKRIYRHMTCLNQSKGQSWWIIKWPREKNRPSNKFPFSNWIFSIRLCFAIETLWFITACVVFEADLCVPIFILYQKNSEQSLTLKELSETKSKKVIEKRISDNNCNNTLYIPFSFLIVRVSWKLFIKAEKTKKSKHWRLNRIVWLKSMPNMWLWTGKKLCRSTLRVRQSGFDLVDYVDKTIFVSHSG